MSPELSLLDLLPEPVLLIAPTGETAYANRAFRSLAEHIGVPTRLSAMFGPPGQVVLNEARRNGSSQAFLPLASSFDTSHGYRLTVQCNEDGSLVVQLADLSAEVEWRHQLFVRNSELAVLNDIGAALSTTLELDVLAYRIWEQTGRIMHHANFFVAVHDREQNSIRFPLWVEDGEVSKESRERSFGNGIAEHVLTTRRALLLNGDVLGQLAELGIKAIGRPSVSFLAAPLIYDGQALGVIALQDYEQPDRYGRHELDVMSIIATQAAAALRNARLYDAARSAYQELSNTQDRLLETERLRGVTETVGALNHEVNNPLATIVGTAQLLLRRPALDPAVRERVQRVLDAAKRIQFVTSKMATLIQANSRPYPGATSILDVSSSVSLAEPRGEEAGLRRPEMFGEPPAAPGDARSPAA